MQLLPEIRLERFLELIYSRAVTLEEWPSERLIQVAQNTRQTQNYLDNI